MSGSQYECRKHGRQRTLAEQWVMEDTLACVRRRLNHADPYEEWERETREEAFVCKLSSIMHMLSDVCSARRKGEARY